MSVIVDWVDRKKRGVAANVTTSTGTRHRVGHLASEGWFCMCSRGKRCKQIERVKEVVIDVEEL